MKTHEETPGERAVKAELRHLKIEFVQEYRIDNLKGDSKKYRVADFYLPKYDTYVEFLGNWNTNEGHKKRYREKKRVYERNNIRCIWIYPNQLHYTKKVIQEGLPKLQEHKPDPEFENEPELTIKETLTLKGVSFPKPRNKRRVNAKPRKKRRVDVRAIVLAIIVVFSVIYLFNEFEIKAEESPRVYLSSEERIEKLYSETDIGMTALDFWGLIFYGNFQRYPGTEGTKIMRVFYGSFAELGEVRAYFDDIAVNQIVAPGQSGYTFSFTDAQIIKVEHYYNGTIVSKKSK